MDAPETVRAYASQIQYGWGAEAGHVPTKPEEYADATRRAIADGYDSVKVDPIVFSDLPDGKGFWPTTGPLPHRVVEAVRDRMAAIREAGGPGLDIILEHHAFTDTTSAIQIGKAVADLRVYYYEEPVHSLNPVSTREIANAVDIPLAAGERLYTRLGFRPFLEDRSLAVIQPDVCLCGGITETKKVCDMAWAHDVSVQIHVCGGPIATAAALQIEAVLPNFLIHEHHQRALDPAGRATCLYDYQPVDGAFAVPDVPGIGQELTEEAIERAETVTVTRNQRYMTREWMR
ncbi:mandelate racemase/muconate lactonizing enzyme family protein [Streptomyces sp. NPDC048210]|uniref:mandelate racemase/muconate lactonizing enzyme family protein n=1 Tax=Streptomyces sp. NPDC048210 TaxID=3156657 RepID=UPI00342ACEF5